MDCVLTETHTHTHTHNVFKNVNVSDSGGAAEGLNITLCQNTVGADSGWRADRPGVNVTGENGNSHGQIGRRGH